MTRILSFLHLYHVSHFIMLHLMQLSFYAFELNLIQPISKLKRRPLIFSLWTGMSDDFVFVDVQNSSKTVGSGIMHWSTFTFRWQERESLQETGNEEKESILCQYFSRTESLTSPKAKNPTKYYLNSLQHYFQKKKHFWDEPTKMISYCRDRSI